MTTMRAKVRVTGVTKGESSERVQFQAVCAARYPEDGSDEDNTYARFSPQADFSITIANPALLGKFEAEQRFYVDFTPADNGVAQSPQVRIELARLAAMEARLAELQARLDSHIEGPAVLEISAEGVSSGHLVVLPNDLSPGDYISVSLTKADPQDGAQ